MKRVRRETPAIAVVIPVLNEAAAIEPLVAAMEAQLKDCDFGWTVLFVDDGSTDGTLEIIRGLCDREQRFSGLSLSRNFGKEMAIAAGLRNAHGDAVVLMDADLQHPPETIPDFVARWREGFDVVFGERMVLEPEGLLRAFFSRLFYLLFRSITRTRLPIGATDFVLLDRVAVDAVNALDERTRFSKGLHCWIGFKSSGVPFVAPMRANGRSRWPFFKLLHYALDGLLSFSSLPLKIWSYLGAGISLASLVYAGFFFTRSLLYGVEVPGFPSLIVSIMLFAGVQLISLGIIGEYLSRVFDEVKRRPLYIVAERIGDHDEAASDYRHGAEVIDRR